MKFQLPSVVWREATPKMALTSVERSCTMLVACERQASPTEIKEALEGNDAEAKVDAMKKAIMLLLSGEQMPQLFITIVRYVLPSEDHTVQKLLLLYLVGGLEQGGFRGCGGAHRGVKGRVCLHTKQLGSCLSFVLCMYGMHQRMGLQCPCSSPSYQAHPHTSQSVVVLCALCVHTQQLSFVCGTEPAPPSRMGSCWSADI